MEPFGVKANCVAIVAAAFLAIRAVKKRTLTKHGAIVGCFVGYLVVGTGLRGFVLFFFYQIGSAATKYKKSFKDSKDATIRNEGVALRGSIQVLAVSIIVVVLSLYHAVVFGKERPIEFHHNSDASSASSCVSCAILAHHATCLADTLASELGILAKQQPILITQPWRKVPPGTNGGITLLGTVWSLLGGLLMAMLTMLMDLVSGVEIPQPLSFVVLGACCGVLGSCIDSILGATVQATYYDPDTKLVYHANSSSKPKSIQHICGSNYLTNEQVNLVSALITTVLGGWVMAPFIYGIMNNTIP